MNRKPLARDEKQEQELEKAGWKTGDAADFLELSDEERAVLDFRVRLALAIRRSRKLLGVTQKDLAKKLNTTQPRVVRIERAATDVTVDQMFRALVALGGKLDIVGPLPAPAKQKPRSARPARRKPRETAMA